LEVAGSGRAESLAIGWDGHRTAPVEYRLTSVSPSSCVASVSGLCSTVWGRAIARRAPGQPDDLSPRKQKNQGASQGSHAVNLRETRTPRHRPPRLGRCSGVQR
jgi:hypothetical protein